MPKILLSTLQVVEAEILRLQARRNQCLLELNELQTDIKNLQKFTQRKEKKGTKKNEISNVIQTTKEV